MKTLKFDFISDLHLDFYMKSGADFHKRMDVFVKEIMPDEPSDILIVAGDTANNNETATAFFQAVSKIYDQVFYTLGNHEFYVHNPQPTSVERVNQLCDQIYSSTSNVHWLNGGGAHYVDGFAIGGTHMWYDGSYAKQKYGYDGGMVYQLWTQTLNDARMITFDVFKSGAIEEEKAKLRNIYKELDLIVTHVPPVIGPGLPFEHQNPVTGFFGFDGEEFMDGPAKAWVYGHTHQTYNFIHHEKDMLCNPLGYPGERPFGKIETWEIEK